MSQLFIEVSVHLVKRFQSRRLKCEKLRDNGCQVMTKALIAFQPGELKNWNTYKSNHTLD
jgi:hypothetical protein